MGRKRFYCRFQWDEQVIGDGKPGPVSRALVQLLEDDMRSGDRLIPVPY
jgi:4-amino-4-deoxychorismate lyase